MDEEDVQRLKDAGMPDENIQEIKAAFGDFPDSLAEFIVDYEEPEDPRVREILDEIGRVFLEGLSGGE